MLYAGMLVLLWAMILELAVRVLLVVSPLHLPVLGDASEVFVPSLVWNGAVGPFRSWSATRGWQNEPGVHRHTMRDGSYWPTESIEATGARRKTPVKLEREPGVRRAVVVGDSFTYGMEVGDDEVFTAVAERELPGWEILNYAVPGYGQDQALLALRERGLPAHPDVVIFGFVFADLERNLYDFTFGRKPRFVLGEHGLTLTAVPVPDAITLAELDRRRIRTFDVVHVLQRQLGYVVPDYLETLKLSEAILGAVIDESIAAGAKPILIYIPEPLLGNTRYVQSADSSFATVCAAKKITCLDLRPAFDAAADRGVDLVAAQHTSPEGHRIIADALAEALRALDPIAAEPAR